MSSKTTNSTTMFIYIAMVIMGVSIIVSLTNYFSFFNILRAICGMIIIWILFINSTKESWFYSDVVRNTLLCIDSTNIRS